MVALVSKPPVPKKNAHTQPRRYAQLFTDDAGLTQRGLDNVSKNSTRPPPRRPRYDITEHDVSSHTSIRLELEKTRRTPLRFAVEARSPRGGARSTTDENYLAHPRERETDLQLSRPSIPFDLRGRESEQARQTDRLYGRMLIIGAQPATCRRDFSDDRLRRRRRLAHCLVSPSQHHARCFPERVSTFRYNGDDGLLWLGPAEMGIFFSTFCD